MLTSSVTVERIARTCHEANRAYCIALGDTSQPAWDDAPEWQRQSAINGVLFHLENPGAAPSAIHENWMAEKIAAGWVYGAEKNPDATPPTHPCLVPFEELPEAQRAKDHIFGAIVAALSYAPPAAAQEAPVRPAPSLGLPVVVNTPGRPLDGVTRHAGIVTGAAGETVCHVTVFPAGKPPFYLLALEREDTIDRPNNPNKASWEFTS